MTTLKTTTVTLFAATLALGGCISGTDDTCIDTAEGVRCTAAAAAEKFPVSAIATSVLSKSRSSSGMLGKVGAFISSAPSCQKI